MEEEFQPFYEKKTEDDFTAWEIEEPIEDVLPVIAPEILAQEEQQRVLEQAREQGFAEGMRQAEGEIEKLRDELLQWLEVIKKPILILDKAISEEMIQTLFWLCESCIGLELSLNPEKILTVIEEIKKELPTVNGLKELAMHPQDIEWLKNHLDRQKVSAVIDMLTPDESLGRGDFYLRGTQTELDGRLKTRFKQLFSQQFKSEEDLAKPTADHLDIFYDSV